MLQFYFNHLPKHKLAIRTCGNRKQIHRFGKSTTTWSQPIAPDYLLKHFLNSCSCTHYMVKDSFGAQ